ncbi:(2Fe-2S)-binding protein [Spongiibacter sp. UBA1325]|uniref:(2Fe-2S)-binding protein n=1 Tax=Spongiibacter sp. UBA1325 TaxID=1947543 RepID=UPI0025802A91|nr:(2Fe-2S)-binding protein [Spongiibacter sp. UBA1325]MEE2654072.1 (2Fe-2S)-binding protein [Pseudomonadota bacterium]|tara:strand:+ start:14633 stop:15166 length:534 start_codon:yes stop_codon:yes gene_type:complete
MTTFTLNGKKMSSDAPGDTPLLWVIRDEFGLKGTKFGCGIAMCGACTVHMNGNPMRSCSLPLSAVNNADIRTIEGLEGSHPLQQAWVEEQVPQCGYCQSGQIMQAAALLANKANPSDEEIVQHMSGNLCRCMSYVRIKRAIKKVAQSSDGTIQIYDPKRNTVVGSAAAQASEKQGVS